MGDKKISYQRLVSTFNRRYKNYFLDKKPSDLELEIWYQIYLNAKQSNTVDTLDLEEMANILYNSYEIKDDNSKRSK